MPTTLKWAGCNIYWDGQKLAFDDVDDKTHEKYQGVYFKWGSLVAIAPQVETVVLYAPSGEKYSNYDDIPCVDNEDRVQQPNSLSHLLNRHDPNRDIGDICKYMTDKGWAPGSAEGKCWRMPTLNEFGLAEEYTFEINSAIKGSDPNGTLVVESGVLRDGNRFPITGAKYESFLEKQDAGYYWSGSAYSYIGGVYRSGSLLARSGILRDAAVPEKAMPVRCVVATD